MNFNPNIIALRAIQVITDKIPFIDRVIAEYETTKTLTCFNGIRPTIPSTLFPSFEIETGNVQTEWATTRSQRHHANFRCMLTISASANPDLREEYVNRLASCIVAIFNSPSLMKFSLWDKTLTGSDYRIDCYDSMVENCSYSSTRDGTIGVAEFYWTAHCDELINNGEFYLSTGNESGLIAPFPKK